MKIQFCSDLHLEFQENKNFLKRFPLKPEGEILLLAGDIVLLKLIKENDDFFNFCSDNFEVTYWIPGNHEYYHYDLNDVNADSENFNSFNKKIRENVFLLNNQKVVYKNVELIFSTLWSYIPPQLELTVQQSVNDFRLIKVSDGKGRKSSALTAHDFNMLHKNDLTFLKSELSIRSQKQRIVITHHVPTLKHYPAKYIFSNINSAFVTELHDFIESTRASYWIYGHHHCNIQPFKIGKTMLLTNQLGYVHHNEHQIFNPSAIIEI